MSEKKPGRRPAHQNKTKFVHNPNSRLTTYIYSIHHSGLCNRCEKQIEWRKTYRKYKPLDEPNRCHSCEQPTVRRAYHILCEACARERGACAKCLVPCSEATFDKGVTDEEVEHLFTVSSIPQRQKRTLQRNWERGALRTRDVALLLKEAEAGNTLDWREYKMELSDDDDDDEEDDDDKEAEPQDPIAAAVAAANVGKPPVKVSVKQPLIRRGAGRIDEAREAEEAAIDALLAAARAKAAARAAKAEKTDKSAPAASAAAEGAASKAPKKATAAAASGAAGAAAAAGEEEEAAVPSKFGTLGGKSLGAAANMDRKLRALSSEATAGKTRVGGKKTATSGAKKG